MLLKRAVKAIVIPVLLSLAATAMFGQGQAGVLYSSPGVTVNGKPITGDIGVFPGDKIQTGPMTAELRLEGTLISLRPNSSLVLAKTLEFGCGAVEFFTFKQAPLRAGGAEITPVSTDATKFQLVHAGGKIDVRMVMGAVTITRNGQTSTLRAGESVSLPGDTACPAMPQAPAEAPAAAKSNKGKVIGILVGVGGAGAVAGVLAGRSKGEGPVSPSRP